MEKNFKFAYLRMFLQFYNKTCKVADTNLTNRTNTFPFNNINVYILAMYKLL